MPFLASEGGFGPLTAFMKTKVKKNYFHIKNLRILNKLSEIEISQGTYGLAVIEVISLSGHLSNIDEILSQKFIPGHELTLFTKKSLIKSWILVLEIKS